MSDIEEIKMNVLRNASEYWHLWSQNTKEELFKIVYDFYAFEDSWRVQQLKGQLIQMVVKSYSVQKLVSELMFEKWISLLQ